MQISVKLVKAFVQPDGSYGNGAGVVLLPRLPRTENKDGDSASRDPETSNALFPPSIECLKIAKRVGLPETSFVAFPEETKLICENSSIFGDGGGQKDKRCVADTTKERFDFHVKWYTPECEVDMCGHATVALAGYIHSIINEKGNSNVGVNCGNGKQQQNGHFWKMQCKAGLLGIEVVEGIRKRVAGAGDPSINNVRTRESNEPNKDTLDSLPRVVMEQTLPEFCGIIHYNEIAASLNIEGESDLAITAIDDKSEQNKRTEHLFPFPHCEIVSTGGRDLMVPVRSTILNEMNILGEINRKDNSVFSSENTKIQELCRDIDIVSKRYNIVGYHMFGVDDSLFQKKLKASPRKATTNESTEEQNVDVDSPISLNELIRIFQIASEMGTSATERCLQAVGISQKGVNSSAANAKVTVPKVERSQTIVVTGVRNFAPAVGIPEEPATGSANGALACYLVRYLFLGAFCGDDANISTGNGDHQSSCLPLDSPVIFRFCMEQGRAMGEPCLIDAEIEVVKGEIRTVKVGGLVSVTGDSLDLDLASI